MSNCVGSSGLGLPASAVAQLSLRQKSKLYAPERKPLVLPPGARDAMREQGGKVFAIIGAPG